MKILKWVDKNLESVLLMIMLVLIASIMMLQVVFRYVFNASLSWPEEISRYLFVWTTFVSIGYCIRYNSQLKIEVLQAFIPVKLKKGADIAIQLVVLGFWIVMFKAAINSYLVILKSNQTSSALELPMAYVYFSTVVGFGLGIVRSTQMIVLTLLHRVEKPLPSPEEDIIEKIEHPDGNASAKEGAAAL